MNKLYAQLSCIAVSILFFSYLAPAIGAKCTYNEGDPKTLLSRMKSMATSADLDKNESDKVYVDCLLSKAKADPNSLTKVEKDTIDEMYNLLDRDESELDEYGEPY